MDENFVEEREEFVKERNEAMLSMDKKKIIDYCKKYKICLPPTEELFWAGVHKTVCNLFLVEDNKVSIEQYQESYRWLEEHGFRPNVGG